MSTTDKFCGLEHLRFDSPYAIQQITDVRVERRVNEHAKMVLTGIIPEEKRHSCIFESTGNDKLALYVNDGDGEKPLFRGLMTDLQVRMVRGIYYITVEATSYTVLYDREYRTRSFQNASMRYEDLIHHIIAPYSNSDCIDMASNKKTIPKVLVQYEETDWDFLKRLASHFNKVLIPDATMDGPKFFCGVPIGRNGEIENSIYDYKKNLNEFRYAEANGESVTSCDDFLVYTVESGKMFNMGDNITFRGDRWKVSGIEARMDGGLLKFRYELSKEPSIRHNFIYNDKIVGASLQGKVIDVTKDTVKIHLDVDKSQPLGEASWFSYTSPYTAEGNSGFYCMPEKGDSVMLYFPDGEEKEASAMSSVRKGGGSSPKHADPSTKYWGAPNGKELKMTPTEVSLTAQEGSIYIKMTDDGGIIVQSDKPLTITSKKDLVIDATKKLVITAKEGVEMICDTSSIILDGQTDIKGSVIKMEGIKKNPVSVPAMPELDEAEVQIEEAPKPEKKSFWGGFLDGVQLALDVVGMIPGLGEVADIANGVISLGRGDYVGAALSFAAALPVGGQAATAAKWAYKAGKATKAGKAAAGAIKAAVKVVKAGDRLKNVIDKADILKKVRRQWSQLGKVFTAARKMPSNLALSKALSKLSAKMAGVTKFASGAAKVANNMYEAYENLSTLSEASAFFFGTPDFMEKYAISVESQFAMAGFGMATDLYGSKKRRGSNRDSGIMAHDYKPQNNAGVGTKTRDASAEVPKKSDSGSEQQTATAVPPKKSDVGSKEKTADATKPKKNENVGAEVRHKDEDIPNEQEVPIAVGQNGGGGGRNNNNNNNNNNNDSNDDNDKKKDKPDSSDKPKESPEREKTHRERIDGAKTEKEARDARYDRYCEEKKALGQEPMDRDKWDVMYDRLKKSRESGREEEPKGRDALKEHIGRDDLTNNNAGEVETKNSSEDYKTRPDSIGRNADDKIDIVHDHKHKTSGDDQVVYDTSQMRAQREMLEDKENGRHIVTISSDDPDYGKVEQPKDNSDLDKNEQPKKKTPKVRPSGPLGVKSEVYYVDKETGKITHVWEPDETKSGGGSWKEVKKNEKDEEDE